MPVVFVQFCSEGIGTFAPEPAEVWNNKDFETFFEGHYEEICPQVLGGKGSDESAQLIFLSAHPPTVSGFPLWGLVGGMGEWGRM